MHLQASSRFSLIALAMTSLLGLAAAAQMPAAPGTGGTTTGSPNTGVQGPGTRTNAGTTTAGSSSAGPSGGAYAPQASQPSGAGATFPAPNAPYAGTGGPALNLNTQGTLPANVRARSSMSSILSTTPRRVVTLREALKLTATQGPDVAAARATAAIAEAGVRRAWTAWQPEIFAQGTFDHTNAPQSLPLGALAGPLAQIFGITLSPQQIANAPTFNIVGINSHYGTLQITQPFLSAQGLFGPGIASHGAKAAQEGADEAREQILLGAAQAYFALQGIEGLLQAAHDLETVALHREDEAQAQIRAGTAVELQLLRAQNDTAQARVQIANLEGSRESLLPMLESLTGEAIAPLPAGSPNPLPTPSPIDQEPWENAFSVRSAIEAVHAQEGAVRLDEFLWLPQIAGTAKGNYTSNPAFTGKNYSYDLILSANIPLYDKGSRYAALHEDQAKLQHAMAQLAGARAKAKAAWIGARANLAAAQAALAQAMSQGSVATRAQTQVDASFKAGVATSLDLSDADNKRFSATSGAAQARTVVDLRKAELAAAEGHLFSAMVGDEQK